MKQVFLLALLSLPLVAISQTEDNKTKPEYKVSAIGFYNLENFFDTVDVAGKFDEDFTPTGKNLWVTWKYVEKARHMSEVISKLGTELTPDGLAILGVAEIENHKVLEDLVAQEAIKARNYKIVQYDSPDERGIDCGLIYNPKYFELLGSKPYPLILKDKKTGEIDHTRDQLLVSGKLDGDTIHFIVNHWPSRRGGEKASEWARLAAAKLDRHIIDSLYSVNENAKIVFMGDLNDDPKNASLKSVLKCAESPVDLPKRGLYNPMEKLLEHGSGTMAYRDAWSLFDQLVVSKPLVNKKVGGWQFYKALIFREAFLLQAAGQYKGYPYRTFDGDTYISGYSDHLPVYLFLLKEK